MASPGEDKSFEVGKEKSMQFPEQIRRLGECTVSGSFMGHTVPEPFLPPLQKQDECVQFKSVGKSAISAR